MIVFGIVCADDSSPVKCCRISPQNLVCISHAFSAWVSEFYKILRTFCLPTDFVEVMSFLSASLLYLFG